MRHFPLLALTALACVACKDSNVGFLTAPTSVPNSPTGIQNAITGLVSGSRNDIQGYMIDASGYARDGGNYTNTEPRFITYELGINPMTSAWAGTWSLSYTNISQAHQILGTIPNVVPAYTPAQAAAVTGLIQTLEAYNYMIVAEDHDTLGMAILSVANASSPPPAVCSKDGWKFIVALLDSAHANLTTAGATPIPIKLPDGFSAVSATGTSFDAFNRALAGKAGLELAYAIARSAVGSKPTPTTPGSPDQAALLAADSAIVHSAPLYDPSPASLRPEPSNGWVLDGHNVMHNFSGASGDQVNPMNSLSGTYRILNTIPSSQDTVNDLRWKAKFSFTSVAPQQQAYDAPVVPYLYNMYSVPQAYIPIVRDEELVLVRAEIEIGLGNYTTAATLINAVRTQVGGLAPAVIPNTYTGTRDAMLSEQQISTAVEASGDRMIAIRMYGLAAQLDTTWGANDLHSTVTPIPFSETSARGGSFPTTCQ